MGLCRVRSCRSHGCVRFVDQSDSEAFKAALEDVPALVLIATPSNPLMRVVDISVLSGLAKEAAAAVAVDNSFLSPAIQKPISLGSVYVVQPTTNYLNGHSEVICSTFVPAHPRTVQEPR